MVVKGNSTSDDDIDVESMSVGDSVVSIPAMNNT